MQGARGNVCIFTGIFFVLLSQLLSASKNACLTFVYPSRENFGPDFDALAIFDLAIKKLDAHISLSLTEANNYLPIVQIE